MPLVTGGTTPQHASAQHVVLQIGAAQAHSAAVVQVAPFGFFKLTRFPPATYGPPATLDGYTPLTVAVARPEYDPPVSVTF